MKTRPAIHAPVQPSVREAAREYLLLSAVLDDAAALEYERPPGPLRARDDTTERSHGARPADPTGDVALDPRRLALREEADRARGTLAVSVSDLRAARLRLQGALDAWAGVEADTQR